MANTNPYLDQQNVMSPVMSMSPTGYYKETPQISTGPTTAPQTSTGVVAEALPTTPTTSPTVASESGGLMPETLQPKPVTPGSQYITPESTVSGQLLSLLGTDSPYLKQAEVGAREQANKLGLLSSSMAVGSAERARIQAALPIAQQNAELYGTSALQSQGAEEKSALTRQGHLENLQALEAQAGHQLRLEAFSQDAATKRTEMELKTKADIANVEMDADTRQQYLDDASKLGVQYNNDVSAILRSPYSPEDRDRALSQLEQVYTNNMNFLASAAGVPLDWENVGEFTPQYEKQKDIKTTISDMIAKNPDLKYQQYVTVDGKQVLNPYYTRRTINYTTPQDTSQVL